MILTIVRGALSSRRRTEGHHVEGIEVETTRVLRDLFVGMIGLMVSPRGEKRERARLARREAITHLQRCIQESGDTAIASWSLCRVDGGPCGGRLAMSDKRMERGPLPGP